MRHEYVFQIHREKWHIIGPVSLTYKNYNSDAFVDFLRTLTFVIIKNSLVIIVGNVDFI